MLFSGAMVRAIQSGVKSQTRRVIKPSPIERDGRWFFYKRGFPVFLEGPATAANACPYGQAGDRIWVREAFSGARAYETHGYPLKEWGNKIWFWADGNPERGDWTKPRPSIHMPRHLSRITLEIVGVRVERLQDISTMDAWAEGIPDAPPPGVYVERVDDFVRWSDGVMREDPKAAYRQLWESINGPGSWSENPWVWIVEFRRV